MNDMTFFPRPNLTRDRWTSLNGEWKFAFDDGNKGLSEKWYRGFDSRKSIIVPFCYQSELSGINTDEPHDTLWYEKSICIAEEDLKTGHILLHFGAVDYKCSVYVNGEHAGDHVGGSTHFSFEIEGYLQAGENRIVVRVVDTYSVIQPRGKQCWDRELTRCWYTPTSGIWRDVWLEYTGNQYIEKILFTPDIDMGVVTTDIYMNAPLNSSHEYEVYYELFFKEKSVKKGRTNISKMHERIIVSIEPEDYIDNIHVWSPQHPALYDVKLLIFEDGSLSDEITSHFGMRNIECRDGYVFLNHEELYQRLVLDQGYFPKGIMTPKDKDAFRQDLLLAKELGFNGVRMHQKFEDPWFYYEASRLGMLIWAECPSTYEADDSSFENTLNEWKEFVEERYNDPSIITWVPINESWGMREILTNKKQQEQARALYHLTKGLDPTRLVSTNDGWETIDDTDIIGIHDYENDPETLTRRYADLTEFMKNGIGYKLPICVGSQYKGQPFLLTEYGGISMEDGNDKNWGYHEKATGDADFLNKVQALTEAVQDIDYCRGFCYTQLTDVMQETNGLLTIDRKVKADKKELASIFMKKVNPEKP